MQHRSARHPGKPWEVLSAMFVVLSVACGASEGASRGSDSDDDAHDDAHDDAAFDEEAPFELGQLEQALYESTDIRTTAGAAMVDAYHETLADGDLYEYCGLIIKVSATKFRASAPETSTLSQFCEASEDLRTGEVVVGYYHTHTPASKPGISEKDKVVAGSSVPKREYFVLSTATGCGQQYSPSTGATTNLGCPF